MSSSIKTSKFENLTKERLEELANRDDCVVYEPTYDTVFEPWPAQRVEKCVRDIVRVTKKCSNSEEAVERTKNIADVLEFSQKYQLMFNRLTDPSIARNQGHVDTFLSMIKLRSQIENGIMSEADAQRTVSEEALTRLLAQAQARSMAGL